jgi:2-oxoglutarate dehydrogenase E2 component (dihydrolipoamide succinyltransferase)
MSIAVQLPALGESVVEGTVSRWLVKVGDRVERDQPLVEVTTDKVDAEIPAPAAGVVEKILVREGEVVAVGATLATLDPAGVAKPTAASTWPPRRAPRAPAAAAAGAPAPAEGKAVRATPLARRAAEQAGVDLAGVAPSGPSGRVTRDDVARRAGAAERRPAYLDYSLQPGDRVIPMSPLRRLVAEHMVVSKRVSPHVGAVAGHSAPWVATRTEPSSGPQLPLLLPFIVPPRARCAISACLGAGRRHRREA